MVFVSPLRWHFSVASQHLKSRHRATVCLILWPTLTTPYFPRVHTQRRAFGVSLRLAWSVCDPSSICRYVIKMHVCWPDCICHGHLAIMWNICFGFLQKNASMLSCRSVGFRKSLLWTYKEISICIMYPPPQKKPNKTKNPHVPPYGSSEPPTPTKTDPCQFCYDRLWFKLFWCCSSIFLDSTLDKNYVTMSKEP